METARPQSVTGGFFLVLEGMDGAGTTSQQTWLCQHLFQQGFLPYKTAEPTENPTGKLIRQVLRGEHGAFCAHALALLFAADRADHLEREILPALSQGQVVVCDRYVLSSLAYQTTAGVATHLVEQANAAFGYPDLTVFFDLSVETAAQRRAKRDQKPEIFEVEAFQRQVAARYREQADAWLAAGRPIVRLDAGRSFEEVSEELAKLVLAAIQGQQKQAGPPDRASRTG